jgi:hypothetical protein
MFECSSTFPKLKKIETCWLLKIDYFFNPNFYLTKENCQFLSCLKMGLNIHFFVIFLGRGVQLGKQLNKWYSILYENFVANLEMFFFGNNVNPKTHRSCSMKTQLQTSKIFLEITRVLKHWSKIKSSENSTTQNIFRILFLWGGGGWGMGSFYELILYDSP